MKILVTGGNGFVGQHLVPLLESKGHEVFAPSSSELDLLKEPLVNISRCLRNNRIDAIVHLAATVGGIGINKDNPGRFLYENVQMGINVLESARLSSVNKVVNIGTVCAYPKHTPVPFKEENIWQGYPEETNAPYGIAKKTVMEMGIGYAKQYGMDITNLIPVNMVGECDNFDEYSSHVIPALIKKFESPRGRTRFVMTDDNGPCKVLDDTLDNPESYVELWGTGSASREFLYAGDLARAISKSLQINTGPDPINIGTGKEITIKNLAELIKKIGKYDAEISWDDSKPNGQPRRCLDITRAKNILKWEPVISLEESIERTIDWYRNNEQ